MLLVTPRERLQRKLSFSPEAQKLFNDWRTALEMRLRSGEIACQYLESHLSKYRKLIPSLAVIFELTNSHSATNVTEENLSLSIKWGSYLEHHARKIYHSSESQEQKSASLLAEKIKAHKIVNGEKLRDIHRRGWSGLKTSEQLNGAIGILTNHHWVKNYSKKIGNSESQHLAINPKLFQETK